MLEEVVFERFDLDVSGRGRKVCLHFPVSNSQRCPSFAHDVLAFIPARMLKLNVERGAANVYSERVVRHINESHMTNICEVRR